MSPSQPAITDDDAPASLAQRARAHSLRMLKGLVPSVSVIALAHTDETVANEHFAAALASRRFHRHGWSRGVAVLAGAGLGVCGGTAMPVIVGLVFSLVVS